MSEMIINEISVGMLFGKYRCPHCNNILNREKQTKIVSKEDADFLKYYKSGKPHNTNYIGLDEITVITYRYRCNGCNQSFSYETVREYKQEQKARKKK